MLLTLTLDSLRKLINARGKKAMDVLDAPDFAINTLNVRGLNVGASMLSGWSLEDLDALRDRADKAGCPCLVLYDQTPLALASGQAEASIERIRRLAVAANRLGCNALSIRCAGKDDESVRIDTATALRQAMPAVERLELNLLIAPTDGLTHDPNNLQNLIKRVGGFRIGALPSFAHAASLGDTIGVLRKLAPYAGAIHGTIQAFDRGGKHPDYDPAACIAAIGSVGFVNTVAIDYVGNGDPVKHIERARDVMQAAIEAE